MRNDNGTARPVRTVLDQLIRERRETLEEFAEHAATFAREHDEPGTISVRHLQRLIAGTRSDGRPLGAVRPATARLLERIFDLSIEELLSPPDKVTEDDSTSELSAKLRTSAKVDQDMIDVLRTQLNSTRVVDRRLGAVVAHDEVRAKICQVQSLMSHNLSANIRPQLAEILSELCMLAGWQALDLRRMVDAWQNYDLSKSAASETLSKSFEAHTSAQQAFVLIDLGKSSDAVEVLNKARTSAEKTASPLLRAWLAAAHGETLAADSQHANALRAFDEAATLLPSDAASTEGPYVALDTVHLERWRGHALARLGAPDATVTLANSLERLDPSFTRAEASLRVDLSIALATAHEIEAAHHQSARAKSLAEAIGSARQHHRIKTLTKALPIIS